MQGAVTKKFKLSGLLAWIKTQLSKSDVGLGSVDNVKQYSAENPPLKGGSITLSASWTGAGSPYSQTVTVTGATVTASSKVDLQPTAAQLESLLSDGVSALIVENSEGTLTACALGAAPSAAMTVKCTVEEVG